MRAFLIGLVVGALLVAFGPALLQTFVRGGLVSPAAASASPSAPVPSGVRQRVDAVDRALAQARQTGKAVPVTVTFTDRDLTASAGPYFPQTYSGATLSDPVVRLRAGKLTLDMNATASIIRTTATIVATVAVVSGRPATTIVSATVGGAPLPQQARDTTAAQLDQALAAGLPARFTVSSILIGDGAITVNGVANP